MKILDNMWIGICLFAVFFYLYSIFSEQYESEKAEKEKKRKQEAENTIKLLKIRNEARIIAEKQKTVISKKALAHPRRLFY